MQTYSMQQAQTFVVLLLQRFHLTLETDQPFAFLSIHSFDSNTISDRFVQLLLHFLLFAQRFRYLLLDTTHDTGLLSKVTLSITWCYRILKNEFSTYLII